MDITMVLCLLALGAVVGFAAGLLGIGGGMLLVPFLTMLFTWQGMPSDLVVHAAIATSMTSILFTSISSVRAHHQRGTIRWGIVAAMAPGIIVGGLLSGGAVFAALNTLWLSLFFALFVGYSGWNMLRNKKPKPSRQMPGVVGTSAAGAGIGFLSGLVGAGGGFLSVPFMVWCNVALHNAVSTSAALGFPIALANSVGYVVSGLSEGASQPGMIGFIYWPALVALVCTSVLTAPLGARMAHRLPVATLKRVFACLLFALAAYMLVKAWQTYAAG
ncbi:sulfite exporter TauE/SafE family protein [Achromobacter sp. Marseille-Q4962]|uniref:sulfite exporter TauE/SafE family protein n=1 Tax=Achromobacter sp. Marseille-Q4962 TaxID=2942202 RepID=UPI002074267B|nr:sulfite exporter TauE/SafE family protein [Achromobacter sp. Marseille-Q4962]